MKELAEFFYDQCCGTTSGHMAEIPNNPVIYSLMRATNKGHHLDKAEFASVLQKMAIELGADTPF